MLSKNIINEELNFSVAELNFKITFQNTKYGGINFMSSFESFLTDDTSDLLFNIIVDDNLLPAPKETRELIKEYDTGNGKTIVHEIKDNGGYQFIVKDIELRSCCLMIMNSDFSQCKCALNGTLNMRMFGLNTAVLLMYAYASAKKQAILVHASTIVYNGKGYPFTAKSGTGKSTHVSMWLQHIENCEILNDDNPVIRIIDDTPYIYGSPWSGKTPCYRNKKIPLGGMIQVVRDDKNFVKELKGILAFSVFMSSTTALKYNEKQFNHVFETIKLFVEKTKTYELHCLPNKEAALICKKEITT